MLFYFHFILLVLNILNNKLSSVVFRFHSLGMCTLCRKGPVDIAFLWFRIQLERNSTSEWAAVFLLHVRLVMSYHPTKRHTDWNVEFSAVSLTFYALEQSRLQKKKAKIAAQIACVNGPLISFATNVSKDLTLIGLDRIRSSANTFQLSYFSESNLWIH